MKLDDDLTDLLYAIWLKLEQIKEIDQAASIFIKAVQCAEAQQELRKDKGE